MTDTNASPTHATTLAAIAAAADAAATPPAPPPATEASDAPPAPPPAPAAPATPAAISAASALEMAAMAIPSAREQLSALATAIRADGSEDGFRAACLKTAAGSPNTPLTTSAPTTAVVKPDDKPKAPAIPAPGDVYAARAAVMKA